MKEPAMFTVLRDFATALHRFPAGATLAEGDLPAPLLAQLLRNGTIAAPPKPALPAVAPADSLSD
jgi:hypothetical protein